jgi:hydroxymethylpyrimidine kinase/phosphomethylpyrimidine kinase
MVATSGSKLLVDDAIHELRELLLPMATVLTPNVPEAKLLLASAGKPVPELNSVEDLVDLAKAVQSLGPKYVLVKGGHLPFKSDGTVAHRPEDRHLMMDVLYGEGRVTKIQTSYQDSQNTHGTGCSLACNIPFLTKCILSNKYSCYFVESCEWVGCCEGREERLPICRSRY